MKGITFIHHALKIGLNKVTIYALSVERQYWVWAIIIKMMNHLIAVIMAIMIETGSNNCQGGDEFEFYTS